MGEGGTEKVQAGVQYVEEFDRLSSCVALARSIQSRFGQTAGCGMPRCSTMSSVNMEDIGSGRVSDFSLPPRV
eukprot:253238-Hanusia_phi.AAC.3